MGRLGAVPGGRGETCAQRETSILQAELRGGTPGTGPTATGDRSNWRLGAGHWRGVGQAAPRACRRLRQAAPGGAEGPPPFRGDGPDRRGQPPVCGTGTVVSSRLDRGQGKGMRPGGDGPGSSLPAGGTPAGRGGKRAGWGGRGADGAQGRWAAGSGRRRKAPGNPCGGEGAGWAVRSVAPGRETGKAVARQGLALRALPAEPGDHAGKRGRRRRAWVRFFVGTGHAD